VENQNTRLSNHRLQRFLWNHKELTGQERWVAISIAIHRNEYTLQCCPSQRTLAKYTGIEQSTLSRIINKLRKKNILASIKIPNLENPILSPNQYYFLFDFGKTTEIVNSQNFQGDIPSWNCICIKLHQSEPP
jgi:hypothetical protein